MVVKKYKISREFKKDEKFAPQAVTIVEQIKSYGEPVERATLFADLEKSGKLNTKQSVSRVFSFFRPKLVEAGLLKEIKETVADPEKPAKAAKAEKTEKKPAAAKKGGKKVA